MSEAETVTAETTAPPIQGLPPGLTLSPSGVLSGTPTTAGTYQTTVQVTDADGATATSQLTITVFAPLTISISGLPGMTAGQEVTFQLQVTGGNPASYTWVQV